MSGYPHWLGFRRVLFHTGWWRFLAINSLQMLFGTLDEWLAAPRLLPLLVLKFCFLLGYQVERWRFINWVSSLALASGNPAVDYIGTGGTAARGPWRGGCYDARLLEQLKQEFYRQAINAVPSAGPSSPLSSPCNLQHPEPKWSDTRRPSDTERTEPLLVNKTPERAA